MNLLKECLDSIHRAGCENVVIVCPEEKQEILKSMELKNQVLIKDLGSGLPDAINLGVRNLPNHIKFVSWLGDDDLINQNSLERSLQIFSSNPEVIATYGSCNYIDNSGKVLFINKSGQWAVQFMHFLPNLIPQPGSVIKRDAFQKVGGVKPTYPLSFDFELFFNLRKIGEIKYISQVQGSFRWHLDSQSVKLRRKAVLQTSQIRKNFLPDFVKPFSFLWEPIIILITLIAGNLIKKR